MPTANTDFGYTGEDDAERHRGWLPGGRNYIPDLLVRCCVYYLGWRYFRPACKLTLRSSVQLLPPAQLGKSAFR